SFSLYIFTYIAWHNRSIPPFLSGSEKLFLREDYTSVQDSGSLSGYIRTYVFDSYDPIMEKRQQKKGDSLSEGYMSKLWDFTWINMTQNNLQELKEIWDQWDDETKQLFYREASIPTSHTVLGSNLQLFHFWERRHDTRKKVDAFALGIYGLFIFPKALGHIQDVALDFFDRLDKRVTPVLAILVETFKSLNACRREGEGRFIGCA
ncbi:hypothetical protein Goarm_022980, partial [Gossypium armourianum]|nr:hypothetical protein [Gossypium armourianum]